MHMTFKLCSLLNCLLGLTVAKTPSPQEAQLVSECGSEVSVEVFQANEYFLLKCLLGLVSPEDDLLETFCVAAVTLTLGKGFNGFLHP